MSNNIEEIRRAQRAEGPATVLAIGTATPKNVVFQSERQVDDPQALHAPRRGHTQAEPQHLRLHGHIPRRLPGHRRRRGPQARQGRRLRRHQGVGPPQVRHHPPHLLHHLRRRHARRRLPAHQAPRPPPLCQPPHDVPAGLLRRRHRRPPRQGPRREQPRRPRPRRLLRDHRRHLPRALRLPPRQHGRAGLVRGRRRRPIVGADPDLSVERPIFQMVSASQTILPDSEGAIDGHLREVGLTFHLLKDVPGLISKNIEKSLAEAFSPLGIQDWNSIFWIAHPGGPAILDQVEQRVGLKAERMAATREVLKEYGNMSSACVLFIMDEMRRRSAEAGLATTGEGLEWGVLFGFGPGLSVEMVVLRSVPVVC